MRLIHLENYFKTDSTGIPTPDDILFGDPEYFATRKGVVGEVTQMSPDDYIQKCIQGFRTQGETGDIVSSRSPKLINKYAKMMKDGVKFDMPILDYRDEFSQEGLHRALAAKKLNASTIPVAILKRK